MAHKINVTTDVKVEAYVNVPFYCRSMESKEEYLKDWVKDFHSFIRDHRSQDPVSLDVISEKEDVCSECKERWETTIDNGKEICAWCGAEIENKTAETKG